VIWVDDERVVHTHPERFAPPHHGFAWIRMIGAILVIYGHSWPLVGAGELFPPEWPLQPDEGVLMGFFAMSGFQITESWVRDPHPARFAAKRVLRLWPPMLTVSLGMALIIGPLVTTLPTGDYFASNGMWGYIVNNAGLLTLQHDLPGVFTNNPWPDAVNGSLWTLPMELLAYGGLYVLLLLGAAKDRRRWLAIVALIALVAWDRHLEHVAGAESAGSLLSVPVESLVAFLVAFAIGVVLNVYRIPLSFTAAVAGLAIFALMPNSETGSFWMAIAISYAVVVCGHFWPARLRVPGVWVNGSYGVYVWSFPIQQLFAMAGIRNQFLMLGCAAPVAYFMGTLSWTFIEEPTMRLRHYIAPQEKPREEDEEDDAHGEPEEERSESEDLTTTRKPSPLPRSLAPPERDRPPPPTQRRPERPGERPLAPPRHRDGRPAFPPPAAEESPLTRRLSGDLEPPPRPTPPVRRAGGGRHAREPQNEAPPAPEEETRPVMRRPIPRRLDRP
jgi:peptidoglycan/LPS O-acetylase OafA/YrhL